VIPKTTHQNALLSIRIHSTVRLADAIKAVVAVDDDTGEVVTRRNYHDSITSRSPWRGFWLAALLSSCESSMKMN